MGQSYPLQVQPLASPPLSLTQNSFVLSQTHLSKAPRLFSQWYQKQAAVIIKELAANYCARFSLKHKGISITGARTRWGSCSHRGHLNFSIHLILVPLPVVSYVVAHELAHTLHHNHSKNFWDAVAGFCPEYKEKRKWLKTHGHLLNP